jgi:hypothetical protein
MGTTTATIGIRGTTFSTHDCIAVACPGLKPAVYVGVSNGSILVGNEFGQQQFAAGQFGIIEKGQPPRLTDNPGLAIAPPQAFLKPAAGGRQGVGVRDPLEATRHSIPSPRRGGGFCFLQYTHRFQPTNDGGGRQESGRTPPGKAREPAARGEMAARRCARCIPAADPRDVSS